MRHTEDIALLPRWTWHEESAPGLRLAAPSTLSFVSQATPDLFSTRPGVRDLISDTRDCLTCRTPLPTQAHYCLKFGALSAFAPSLQHCRHR